MTNEDKYAYWLKLAQYDLDSAGAMYTSGRWFYVAFMCQQAIEKSCKGLLIFILVIMSQRFIIYGLFFLR
jgi:HEPN domain-containing protein